MVEINDVCVESKELVVSVGLVLETVSVVIDRGVIELEVLVVSLGPGIVSDVVIIELVREEEEV